MTKSGKSKTHSTTSSPAKHTVHMASARPSTSSKLATPSSSSKPTRRITPITQNETDLDWALRNAHMLSLEVFAQKFGYKNKRNANNRYNDILHSDRFSSCDQIRQLIDNFQKYKGTAKEEAFWKRMELEEKKLEVQHELELDGLENVKHFGLNAGFILRHKSRSHEDLLSLNKRLKTKHDNHDDNGTDNNTQETDWEWDFSNLPESEHNQQLSQDNEEWDSDDQEQEDPASDLSIPHHTERKGNYNLLEDLEVPEEDEDTCSVGGYDAWMVEELNVLDECIKYTDYCFSKLEPKKLDDVGILALNNIYLFTEFISSSVSRHFGRNDLHQKIIKRLDLYQNIQQPNPIVYSWCVKAASTTYVDWRALQVDSVGFLNQGLESKNDLDLMVANVLHRILPAIKISGYAEGRGEDSFVHDVLGPLLDVIFCSDINIKHFWANISLTPTHKDIKPDFGIYANGLSQRFVVLVAEVKPIEGRQKLENDKVKIGKEMKIMINELFDVGIQDPVVSGILVMDDHLYTYAMHLGGPKTYILTELSSTPVTKSADNLVLIPSIVSKLVQLKDLSIVMAEKIHDHAKAIRDGKTLKKSSVPKTWLSKESYRLERTNETKQK